MAFDQIALVESRVLDLLEGTNYPLWKWKITMVLQQQELWEVVSGVEQPPQPPFAEEDAPDEDTPAMAAARADYVWKLEASKSRSKKHLCLFVSPLVRPLQTECEMKICLHKCGTPSVSYTREISVQHLDSPTQVIGHQTKGQ